MKSKIFIIFVVILLSITPVMAAPRPSGVYTDAEEIKLEDISSAHYNVTAGKSIGSIVFDVPVNTNIDFTLYYGGETKTGSIEYNQVIGSFLGFEYSIDSTSVVTLGGNSSQSTFKEVTGGIINRYGITGHAIDEEAGTKGLAVWDTALLNLYTPQNIAYEAVTDIDKKPIYGIDITSDRPVDITISYGDQSYIQTQSAKTASDVISEWVNFFVGIAGDVKDFVLAFYSGLIFIWENWQLILALYIGICAAVAFNQSKDIFSALKKFFQYQKSLFLFMVQMWHLLVTLIESAKNIVTKWI